MLDEVKTALRITHNKLDGEIAAAIEEAEMELVRVGVPWEIAGYPESFPLVMRAVKTYCQSMMAIDQNQAEKYMESFRTQADQLRKSVTCLTEGF